MKVIVAFWAAVTLALLCAHAAQAYPGELDITFAGDGVADTSSPGGTRYTKIAVYPDARTVLAASTRDSASIGAYFPSGVSQRRGRRISRSARAATA